MTATSRASLERRLWQAAGEPKRMPAAPQQSGEPKDSDPTGQPQLERTEMQQTADMRTDTGRIPIRRINKPERLKTCSNT